MRVAFVEWPESLTPTGPRWEELRNSINGAHADLLITNELPFGPWIAEGAEFSDDEAHRSISSHDEGLEGLINLEVPAVISSRPVWNGRRLANEAFVVQNGAVRPLHRKQYFPNEPGFFETEWYLGDDSGFVVSEILGIKVGVLLCTEVMFNERARAYGRQGASLIVVPRASGTNMNSWTIAGAMASLVSGAYVVSSNRTGVAQAGTEFGGGGFAYAPHAQLLAMTDVTSPVQVLELDPKVSELAQREYPCYVAEAE